MYFSNDLKLRERNIFQNVFSEIMSVCCQMDHPVYNKRYIFYDKCNNYRYIIQFQFNMHR